MSHRGYGQFCPVAKSCEIFAERWTLLVVRELQRGSRRFVDIRRGVPLMSPSLLSQRLKALERAGVAERRARGHSVEWQLTESGRETWPIIEAMGSWGQRWAMHHLEPSERDPAVIMWDVRCRVPRDALPARRTVLHFTFADARAAQRYFWLILDTAGADLCVSDPGLPVDLTVRSDVRTLTLTWMGIRSLDEELRAKRIALEGPATVRRRFRDWFPRNYFAGVPRGREFAARNGT